MDELPVIVMLARGQFLNELAPTLAITHNDGIVRFFKDVHSSKEEEVPYDNCYCYYSLKL